jgi:hypothetical protein
MAESLPGRLAFRFVFVYLLLYNLLLALSRGSGSGDRTVDYQRVLYLSIFAAAAALAWTVVDRRGRPDRWLHEGLRICVRYTLALILISYGMSKVFGVQYPFPALDRLQTRLGDSSPMALYTTFMGYSRLYNVFTGAVELLAGLLLTFRRTITLGALLALGAIGNLAMIAFCYDVPMKLVSLHLVAMTAFLLAPQARRLVDGLVLDRPTQPLEEVPPPFSGRWASGLKALVLGGALIATAKHGLDLRTEQRLTPRSPIYGVYDVERFIRNGQEVSPWSGDPTRWRRLIVESPAVLAVKRADDSRRAVPMSAFGWSRPDPDHLVLQGTFAGDALTVRLRRIDESKYLLVSRGFHWINDDPINR